MHSQLVLLFGWFLILGTCLLAWCLGEGAERRGAVLWLAMSLIIALVALFPDKAMQRSSYLLIDGLFGAGLLVLALRYATAWLGVAVLLQAAQFSLHAYYLVAGKPYNDLYATVNNLVSLGVLVSLLVGTVLAWYRRRRAQAK